MADVPSRVREGPADAAVLDSTWAESAPRRAVQFLKTYLVEERPGGLQVTDQHALHERVLFEEIRTRIASGRLPTQRLLVPELVKVTPREQALIENGEADFERLGLLVERCGTDRVTIQGVPEMMRHVEDVGIERVGIADDRPAVSHPRKVEPDGERRSGRDGGDRALDRPRLPCLGIDRPRDQATVLPVVVGEFLSKTSIDPVHHAALLQVKGRGLGIGDERAALAVDQPHARSLSRPGTVLVKVRL